MPAYLNGLVGSLTTQSVRPEVTHGNLITQSALNLYPWPFSRRLTFSHNTIHLPARLEDKQSQHLNLGHKLNHRELNSLIISQSLPLTPYLA
jgi:hypothetical protein